MKVCRKCGTLFDSRNCKVCSKAMIYRWRAANPKKVKSYDKKFRDTHPEIGRNRLAKWKADNPGMATLSTMKWRANNPDKAAVASQNRRARKQMNGGRLSSNISKNLFRSQNGKCVCCGRPLGKNYHLDHRMPLALGGANEDWNMQLLRKRCNHQKGAKHPIEFMQSRGFLL